MSFYWVVTLVLANFPWKMVDLAIPVVNCATETQYFLAESKLRYVRQLKCCISDSCCIVIDFDRVTVYFLSPWMLAISTELSREVSYPKLVIIYGVSACVILSCWWRAGFYLNVSSNHGCVILHLDNQWIINSFVNLFIEKLPWYLPLPQNSWYIPGLMDKCIWIGFKRIKIILFIHFFPPSFPWVYMCFFLRDIPYQNHNCFKSITEYISE